MRRQRLTWIGWLALALCVPSLAQAQLLGACTTGSAGGLPGSASGDIGPGPTGSFQGIACLEIRNDLAATRTGEVAASGIPLARELDLRTTDGLVLVGDGERRIAAQFDVLSRWGGPMDDDSLPIRWLAVSLSADVPADAVARYVLRRYDEPPAASDALAATISADTGGYVVETGVARFVLDPTNPALLDAIAIDLDDDATGPRLPIYDHVPGAGPKLVFDDGTADVTLDTSDPARVLVDPQGFEIVESGPVKVVVAQRGHFSAPGGASLCIGAFDAYERFGYTLVATFERGQRDFDLELHFRNECSDAFSGPWTDQTASVSQVSWELPLSGFAPDAAHYFAGAGAVTGPASAVALETRVEQPKGGGVPWARRARVLQGGVEQESAETLDQPLVAVADATLTVAAQIAWMRYREPQALVLEGSTLSLHFVSEPLIVGEGKGLWNLARVNLVPTALATASSSLSAQLQALREGNARRLERSLLVRRSVAEVNASRLYASLGGDAQTVVKTEYLRVMEELHDDTVREGSGQLERTKAFGAQLWPDIQFSADPEAPDTPADHSGSMNYWNPSGAELFEFLRAGDPRWVWDFALPQSWLQAHAAYLNIGAQEHGNRAGFAVTSGGSGEGQWHRSAFGSDDYSYNMGLELAYALRPGPALRDRFAQAGATVLSRYSIPQSEEFLREAFVNEVIITRQVIQHFVMLANCAEFVPGNRGLQCHDKLMELLVELGEDGLRAGVMCQADIRPTESCYTPQQFMQNALMYGFFHRAFLNYGDPSPSGSIGRALVEGPRQLYDWGLEKQADGESLVPFGNWAAALECELSDGGTEVARCDPSPDSDNNFFMYVETQPHTAALLLMADQLDPSIGLCEVVPQVYEDPDFFTAWNGWHTGVGWWKGSAQMMQGMVFAVGGVEACPEPGAATLAGVAIGTLAALARSRRRPRP